jgi:heptosyltransferase-2
MQPSQESAQIPNPSLQVDQANVQKLVSTWKIDTHNKILGLCPGAEYGEAKRWPAQYYADVARKAIQAGWQVFLFGSTKDQAVTQMINSLTANACRDFAGKTSLGDAVDLMSLCDTLISNDSGLMHIAAALDKKLIAIYGSSDPHHTPPMSSKAVIEYLGLECSPCFERTCKLGHLNCLKHITPDHVMQKIGLAK